MSNRGLGRGFESLIPTDILNEEFDPTAPEDEKLSQLTEIPLEKIVRNEEQPRRDFDEEALKALADSIKEHGILQPIVVMKIEDKYQIVAGERRWRAAKLSNLEKIPAIVRTLDAQNQLELSIIENAQREDLNAIELATAYAKLQSQFNLSTKEVANRIGKSEAVVKNTLRLLLLPEEAQKAMLEHKLTEGVMRPLVSAPKEVIEKILPKIIEEGWSARKVERYFAENKPKSSAKAIKKSQYVKEENSLSKKYNARVRIKGRSLTIACKNETELKELIEKLRN